MILHFHRVVPAPACIHDNAAVEMKCSGNLALHTLEYECPTCYARVRIDATFRTFKVGQEGYQMPVDIESIDSTP